MKLIRLLASLHLAIVLMALSMVLILVGTFAQRDMGIWDVQEKYFHSLLFWIDLGPISLPFPGGYVLGGLMLLNLLAAHVTRFKWGWSRIGLTLSHLGLILLFAGEGLTSTLALESQMMIHEGGSANYTYDDREIELAVIDGSAKDHDQVCAFSSPLIKTDARLTHSSLPFEIRIDQYLPNSELLGPFEARQKNIAVRPTQNGGQTAGAVAVERKKVGGTENKRDIPAAYVTVLRNGREQGTWLLSPVFAEPQGFEQDGKPYMLSLRWRRYYQPYSITLLDFAHDRYTGTSIARNFSSRVRLIDKLHNVDREILIRMNSPLRYRGQTFYQASFVGEDTTILQVVNNPGWIVPYISCVLTGLGLSVHFGIVLSRFLKTRSPPPHPLAEDRTVASAPHPLAEDRAASAPPLPLAGEGRGEGLSSSAPRPLAQRLVPAIAATLCLIYLGVHAIPRHTGGDFDLATFRRLPISFEGRVQPLDSLARNTLKMFSGREVARFKDERRPPIRWLADMMSGRDEADAYEVFRIDEPDLCGLITDDAARKYFSMNDLRGSASKIEEQFRRVGEVDPKHYDRFQEAVARLYTNVQRYVMLRELRSLHLAPPTKAGEDWRPLQDAADNSAALAMLSILDLYRGNNATDFNNAVGKLRQDLSEQLPKAMRRVGFESFYNHAAYEYHCMELYIVVLLLACLSWLGWTRVLTSAALWAGVAVLLVHTLGLIGRIYIAGRPPVTNLQSSAVFIAWGGVIFALGVEWIWRNGLGAISAGMVGFLSLFVAHHLKAADALKGNPDTLKVLVAVLDTNFWLATHVLAITIGYSATFLAGIFGILFVFRGIFTPTLNDEESRQMGKMMYGITCFALLFSYIGTVLGGIWADQSWGRFWGWDPKENGAALIVLWNAIILHALWVKLITNRGLAILCIFGNIVTSWSWFGTNMLGVGLHSYGFMDSAMFWLAVFMASQLVVIGLANYPIHLWASGPAALGTASDTDS